MKHLILIFIFLGSPSIFAEPSSLSQVDSESSWTVRAQCALENAGHQTLIESFRLLLTKTAAKIELNLGERAGSSFEGSLKLSRVRSGDGQSPRAFIYQGFDDLLRDYDVTLNVSESAFDGSHFEAKLYGRGDAMFSEDYVCIAE